MFPTWLPDGRHFLYLRRSDIAKDSGVYVGSLDSAPEQQSGKRILPTDIEFGFVPPMGSSRIGQILFLREGTLMAQAFDSKRLELTGEPTPVAEQIGELGYYASFSISRNNMLIYRAGAPNQTRLTWFGRQGRSAGTVGEPGGYIEFALSPDGTKVAASEIRAGNEDIYILDAARGTRTRLTSDPALDLAPRWSPDGTRIAFTSDRSGHMDLYVKAASGEGAERLLYSGDNNMRFPTSWSRDGRYLLFYVQDPKTTNDLMVLPMDGSQKPLPFQQTRFTERNGDFSPDGHWVAYQSNESGRMEIYARPFPSGAQVPVSTDGGLSPRWRADGKELFYESPSGKLMAVSITETRAEFHAGIPHAVFDVPKGSGVANPWFEVSPDGKRFLFKVAVEQSAAQPLTVVLNWDAGLKR